MIAKKCILKRNIEGNWLMGGKVIININLLNKNIKSMSQGWDSKNKESWIRAANIILNLECEKAGTKLAAYLPSDQQNYLLCLQEPCLRAKVIGYGPALGFFFYGRDGFFYI